MTVLTFLAQNGWTVSIAQDTPPAMSVAAYPTAGHLQYMMGRTAWFKWPDGQHDRRVYELEGLIRALEVVRVALPPT